MGNRLKYLPSTIVQLNLGHGHAGLDFCENPDLVFTEEQKKWANVTDYQNYYYKYCTMSIEKLSKEINNIITIRYSHNLICFTLPYDEYIILEVYNTKGVLIRTLLDAYKKAGEHSVYWKADKSNAGVYIAKLRGAGYVISERIVVVK